MLFCVGYTCSGKNFTGVLDPGAAHSFQFWQFAPGTGFSLSLGQAFPEPLCPWQSSSVALVSGRCAAGSLVRSSEGCQKDLPRRELKSFQIKRHQDRIASIL